MGRQWTSSKGNFHGSTGLALRPDDPPAPTLALVAAVALHAALLDVSRGAVRPTIKWPNDILVGSAKLAGILLERSGDQIVIGIGVNLDYAPEIEGRETIALTALCSPVHPRAFADSLAATVALEVERWRTDGLAALIAHWTKLAHPRGTMLTLTEGADTGLTGAFDGLDASGALRLRLDNGSLHLVTAGEVRYAQ